MVGAVAIVIGYILGLITRGITIKIEHTEKKRDFPNEPAPSSVEKLPPKMKEYAEQNRGFIDF